jgi:hypothetical protein
MKKWLCEFEVGKLVGVKRTKKGKDEDGKEIEISKTLKKNNPVSFKLQKPTRRQFEDGELYYAVKLSEGIKAGLLTTAQVAKRYENDGGVYTDAEKARLRELRNDITELQSEYFKIDGEDETADQDKIRILSQINDSRNEISDIENVHQYIYDQTAEVKARNKTILWWILAIAHKQDDQNRNRFLEMFGSGELDDKLDSYDKMEEDGDNFTQEALKKLAYYVSYWYVSKNVSADDFKTVNSLYAQSSDYILVEDEDEEEKEAKEAVAEVVKAENEKKAEEKSKKKSEKKSEKKAEEEPEEKSEDKSEEKELAEEAK